MAKTGKPKEMEGEVYYPSEQVVAQARLKDWDALAKKPTKTSKVSGLMKPMNLNGTRNGTRFSTTRINHSSSGLLAQRPT